MKKMLMLGGFLCLNLACLSAKADDFDLQQFINSNDMLDFASQYPETRLFVAQKADHTPFNDFNVNEADEFMLGTYTHSVYFDRQFNITQRLPLRFLNFNMTGYDFGVYPISDAATKVTSECHLEQEALTSFSFNHPAVQYDVMIYLFTTQDANGQCTQSLFDTFHKTVSCKASTARCYA